MCSQHRGRRHAPGRGGPGSRRQRDATPVRPGKVLIVRIVPVVPFLIVIFPSGRWLAEDVWFFKRVPTSTETMQIQRSRGCLRFLAGG